MKASIQLVAIYQPPAMMRILLLPQQKASFSYHDRWKQRGPTSFAIQVASISMHTGFRALSTALQLVKIITPHHGGQSQSVLLNVNPPLCHHKSPRIPPCSPYAAQPSIVTCRAPCARHQSALPNATLPWFRRSTQRLSVYPRHAVQRLIVMHKPSCGRTAFSS